MSDQSKPSRWTRVAAYLICLRNNAVLLTQLTKSKQWTFPGGGLEHGEDPYDGVLRELTEETGYSGVIDRLVGIDSATWTYDQGDGPTRIHGLRIVYAGRIVGGSLRPEVNGSTDRVAWVDLDDVPSLPRVDLVDRGMALFRYRPETGHLDVSAIRD